MSVVAALPIVLEVIEDLPAAISVVEGLFTAGKSLSAQIQSGAPVVATPAELADLSAALQQAQAATLLFQNLQAKLSTAAAAPPVAPH